MKKNYTILLLLVSLLASCVERKTVVTESQDYNIEADFLPANIRDEVNEAKSKHMEGKNGAHASGCCDHDHVANIPTKKKQTKTSNKLILGKDPATYTPKNLMDANASKPEASATPAPAAPSAKPESSKVVAPAASVAPAQADQSAKPESSKVVAPAASATPAPAAPSAKPESSKVVAPAA